MAKMIKITKECMDECRREFEEALMSGKFSDGKVTFTKTLGTVDRKAKVVFSEIAWLKMQTLIREFDSEVGWHGIARRGEEPDSFYISDIIVYPQEVDGSTVTTDQEKYQTWLMNHDDEVFNNIRMQGHSHVNMGTSPSAVDNQLYENILGQLDDSMFYIFMIYNKRGEKTVKIYDIRENVFYDTADVTLLVEDGGIVQKFLEEAKKLVTKKTYQNNVVQSYYNDDVGYSDKYSDSKGYKKRKTDIYNRFWNRYYGNYDD